MNIHYGIVNKAEYQVTRQRYRCPQCGKKVLFGEHLCLVGNKEGQSASDEVQEPRPSQAGGGLFKKLGVILIVAFLAGAMLWGFLPWVLTLILGLIILAGVGVALFVSSRRRASSGPGYRSLVKLAGGDKAVAERLIAAELKQYPDFSRSECVRRVHDRLEYEHRR